jgi:hypothetical protein
MKEVTFVLMTCGELTEKKCLAAIEPFLDEIEFFEVRNVFPQIKALNQMIEGVETEFFIALDADMILDYDAWPRIQNAFRKHRHNPEWHSILFPLYDTFTEKKILALKVMRSEVMKNIMFEETATPDVEHYQRLTDSGYTCIHDYLKQRPIGKHVVKGKHFCYYKYRDVYQTYKAHGFEWDSGAFMGGDTLPDRAKAHFHYFMSKWLKTENKDYLWAIAGMMDGITSETKNESKTLQDREYRFSTESGVHCFMQWYMDFGNEFVSAKHCLF